MTKETEPSQNQLPPGWELTEAELLANNGGFQESLLVSPDKAKSRLQYLGYQEADFKRIVIEKIGSHDMRADAIIALSSQSRLEYIIRANLRAIDILNGDLDPRGTSWTLIIEEPSFQTQAYKNLRRAYDTA